MYIKIGTNSKPLEGKVDGGFTVAQPIGKIVSYTIQQSPYFGTPEESFTESVPSMLPPLSVSASVFYYRSYEDYLAVEKSIIFSGTDQVPPPIPDQVITLEPTSLPLRFNNVSLTGTSITNIYEAVTNKINTILSGITTASVVVED
jgi:hypothetical protein